MNRILAATLSLALGAAPAFAAGTVPEPAAAKPAVPAKASPKTRSKTAKKKTPAASGAAFKTEDERTFYAYGYRVGQNLAATTPSAGEANAIAQGLHDAITGKPEAVNMAIYLPKVGEMATKRLQAKAEILKAKGKAFADKFSKEEGVKPIPMGGYIKILAEGTGASPTADDTVTFSYRGTLIDGAEADGRAEPLTIPLKSGLPCWANGMPLMKVGGKAKLVCPSDVAYGDQGHPPAIPGGSTMVYEIELIGIANPAAEKASGKAYADAFAKEAGVKPIPMGGYIKTLKEGTGPTPKPEDTVKVNYRGTFLNGNEFDSSYKRHEPTTFPLSNVIPCWTHGVGMMKVGEKAKLVCPSDVAYGDEGRPGIPGGATLVFEVELLEIVKPEAPKP